MGATISTVQVGKLRQRAIKQPDCRDTTSWEWSPGVLMPKATSYIFQGFKTVSLVAEMPLPRQNEIPKYIILQQSLLSIYLAHQQA